MARYLLHFAHEHIPFRWVEFTALASRFGCDFKLLSKHEHIETRPFIILELHEEKHVNKLIDIAKNSYLLKDLYELWGYSDKSIEDLAENVALSHYVIRKLYSCSKNSFRVNCESFGTKLKQSTKIEWIKKMIFLEEFESRPNLSNPQQIYTIFQMNEQLRQEYYFGRHVTKSDRSSVSELSLKRRVFIANTSMDTMLSLVAANAAKVKPGDIVYDPFVGSGSLLVAAAYKGAYVLGSDIDWLLLHGKSKPTRIGEKIRHDGESVKANMRQYNLQDRYLDVLVSDVTRSPIRGGLVLDSIICDPPYGIRESSEKIGIKKIRPVREYKVKYPSKTCYNMNDLFSDLLYLTINHLAIRGRLVYYLPVTRIDGCQFVDFIPSHPCLQLISYCEQELTAKVSRLMVVMEKTRQPLIEESISIPQLINQMNFRDAYFSVTET